MKSFKFLIALLVFTAVFSHSGNSQNIYKQKSKPIEQTDNKVMLSSTEMNNITAFEESYVLKYFPDNVNNKINLLGYQTMPLGGEMKEKFKKNYENFKNKMDTIRGMYIATDTSFYRIYFPMHTAVVNLNGTEYAADEDGIVKLPAHIQGITGKDNLSIVARVKSDKVSGGPNDIIIDNKIILKDVIKPARFYNNTNTYVFDMKSIQ